MRKKRILVATMIALFAISCSRTVYTGFNPTASASPPHDHDQKDRSAPKAWRHFFVFGWAPPEMVIDAAGYCDGAEHVARIETQRSFVQGVIAAVAGYYVNIYSPYTGRVVCDDHATR
jgi:hypothetical protein